MPTVYWTDAEVEEVLYKFKDHVRSEMMSLQLIETEGKVSSGIFKSIKTLERLSTDPYKYTKGVRR